MDSDSVQRYADAIGAHRFFRGLERDDLHLLASCTEDRAYAGDAYLGRQDERAE